MSEYSEPDIGYIVNSVMEYLSDQRKIDPWTHKQRGVEIDHRDWPVQIQDIITEKNIEFDEDELCYRIETMDEGTEKDYEITSRNATGGDYVDIDQFLGIYGKIGLKVDPATDDALIIDYESTDLELEISFSLSNARSYSGESPPF